MKPTHKSLAIKALSQCAAGLALMAPFTMSAAAQYLPAQQVGGAATYDAPQGNPGNNPPVTVRHRITPLAAIPEDFSTLKLGPGFLLAMEIFDTPEYSVELRIDANGNVNLPMIGSVHLADLTLVEASAKIATAFKDGNILNDPHVNLNIEEYAGRQVTVLGEVRAPGRVEMLAPRHLDDVIAMAGGETEFAGKTIEIRHEAGGTEPRIAVIQYSRSLDSTVLNDTVVRPGDTVTVKRAGIVYVLGGVTRPGGYVMQQDGDLDVTQALALAYGTTMPASVDSMRLIRKKDDGMVEQIPIPYRKMVKGEVAPMHLQAEDVIYVPISKIKTIITATLLNTAVTAAAIYGR